MSLSDILEAAVDKAILFLPLIGTLCFGYLIIRLFGMFLAYRTRRKLDSSRIAGQFVTFVLYVIYVIAAVIVLPISEGTKGQLLSLLGILLTGGIALSSTNFLGNLLAGLMVKSWSFLRLGDWVRVNDVYGRIT